MLIRDHMSRSGSHLFRWRSYILLGFIPFFIYAAFQGETVEIYLGDTVGDLYELFALGLVILGEVIRIVTVGFVPKGTSGRNTNGQLADVLNTTGMYSLVRNPLYLGNCLMYVGIALYTQNIALAAILALVLLPYYERIIAAEEVFLTEKFGAIYIDWANRTPAFLMRIRGFVRPSMPFCARSVIRREQASVLGAVVALYLIELGMNKLGPAPEDMDAGWNWALGLTFICFVAAQIAKKHTQLLAVDGR
jgi:protein-S-isoprenylcysteine O-methyltransferase Ste14